MRTGKRNGWAAISFTFLLLTAFPWRVEAAAAKTEWERTVEAAKKEGQVVLYASDDYGKIFAQFQKRYPEIKVVHVSGRGGASAQRMLSERRAGKYLVDLYLSGGSTAYNVLYRSKILDPIKPALILPEVADQSKWWSGRHTYIDDEREYLFTFNGAVQPFFGYHTRSVNPAEFKSYWDFLNPKWKGKMVVLDPTGDPGGTSGALRFVYHTPELGPEFLRRLLTEMDVTPSRDGTQITNWLAVGKYSISLFGHIARMGMDIGKQQGLPIDWFGPAAFKEGVPLSAANGNVALIDRAPNPNAARVAINWLLSREGQTTFQNVILGTDSFRLDVPKDSVAPYARRVEGVNGLFTDRPEWMDIRPIVKYVNEVWKK
jgi:iron(III) transport system substrate-binding protein